MEWFGGRSTDPYKSTTDIGHIGELKLSDDILVRLFADESITGSLLLHRASYNSYARGVWLAQGAALAPVQPAGTDGFWQLNATVQDAATRHETVEVDTTQVGNRLTIVSRLQAGRGVLPLPSGSRTVEGLVVDELKQNHLGTVRIEKQAPFVRYEVRYRAQAQAGSAAGERDLKIPASESTAITGLAERLNLNQLDTDTAVQIVSDYFHNNFAYSIYQAQSNIGGTPIEVFLEQTRRGHCEYFASATVLLLRAAGVPARYATGYSVQEWSELEQAYIIRQRHAHAWARYYKNGRWHDLDTTPPQWAEIEGEQRSILEPLGDLFSWLRFRFDRWRSGDNDAALSPWWLCALAPLIIYVAWRLRFSKRARSMHTPTPTPSYGHAATPSPFASIEAHLCERHFERRVSESLLEWIARLENEGLASDATHALRAVVTLYYRYRFDPHSDPEATRIELEARVDDWLSAFSRSG